MSSGIYWGKGNLSEQRRKSWVKPTLFRIKKCNKDYKKENIK